MSRLPRSRFLLVTFVTLAPLPATALGQDAMIEAPNEQEPVDAESAEEALFAAPADAESAHPSGMPVAAAPPEVAIEKAGDEVEKPPVVTVRIGEGLTVTSADGDYSIRIRVRAQIRFTALSDSPGEDNESLSFMVRRARLLFQGNLFSEHWLYYVQLGFSNLDMEPDLRIPLRDAYMTSTHLRDLNVRFGQMKVPHDRQRVISSSALQFTDRSIVTAEFNLDRDVGIQALSTDIAGRGGRFGYNVGIFGGDGRNRIGPDSGLLYAARLQFLPMGPFDDFTEGNVARSADPHLAIALSGAFNDNSVRARSTFTETFELGSYDYVHFASDFSFKGAGLSLLGQVFMRDVIGTQERTGTIDGVPVTETSRSGLGYFLQGGYMLTDHLEVAARWGEIRPPVLRTVTTAIQKTGELGGGLSWYLMGHNLKFQADYFWLYGDTFAGDTIDEHTFDSGRHTVRVQAQFFF